MIEAKGVVLSCDGVQVKLSWQSQSSCSSCNQKNDCGNGVVAQAFGQRSNEITLASEQTYAAGTILRLGIAEQTLLRAAALIYLSPLLLALLLALLAQSLWLYEPLTIAAAAIGGWIGFLSARVVAAKMPPNIQILGQLGQPIS